jgi:hypothetical protein
MLCGQLALPRVSPDKRIARFLHLGRARKEPSGQSLQKALSITFILLPSTQLMMQNRSSAGGIPKLLGSVFPHFIEPNHKIGFKYRQITILMNNF